MSGPKYGISTYGKTIIIDEGKSETELIRIIYLAWTGLMCIWVNTVVCLHYRKVFESSKKTPRKDEQRPGLRFILLMSFLLSNTLRTLHLLDHMYRPVYYFEPKWAYQKYLVTEIEIPTYIDVTICIFGIIGMPRLLNELSVSIKKISLSVTTITLLILYSVSSGITVIHYFTEPPYKYGIDANFTISGTVVTAVAFGVLVIYTWVTLNPTSSGDRSRAGADHAAQERLIRQDTKDEYRTRSQAGGTSARRRSQTPK
jgi:hypothetical protein